MVADVDGVVVFVDFSRVLRVSYVLDVSACMRECRMRYEIIRKAIKFNSKQLVNVHLNKQHRQRKQWCFFLRASTASQAHKNGLQANAHT